MLYVDDMIFLGVKKKPCLSPRPDTIHTPNEAPRVTKKKKGEIDSLPILFLFLSFFFFQSKSSQNPSHTQHTHTLPQIRDIGRRINRFRNSTQFSGNSQDGIQLANNHKSQREREGINILTILTDLAGSRGWWSVDCRLVGEEVQVGLSVDCGILFA